VNLAKEIALIEDGGDFSILARQVAAGMASPRSTKYEVLASREYDPDSSR
jgi:hypothetical protein